MRLIDADALPSGRVEWEDIVDAPTVDAVPVVRCKDCFLYGECKLAEFIGDDGYCSCGKERR